MSFEWNKIAAAFLACAFVILGVNFLSDGLYHSKVPEQQGYAIEGAEVETAGDGDSQPAGPEPVNALLASVDIADGEKVAKKCVACHSFDEGGGNKVGPALYGVVERQIASVDGFGYSPALKTYAEGGKTWTYDELNGFLNKPKAHVEGTTMGFAGLKKVDERAEIIAYLRSLAATPAALPDPAAAGSESEGAADTSTKDATVVTPAPGSGDTGGSAGGATATELVPVTPGEEQNEGGETGTENEEAAPADSAPQTEEAPSD